ncbi:MAG TPA: DUF721 domain-containing protein [candidate division WOR-3 bacterium]|uniref:DUF721 domain-containing protein n=1 Tax=candidate division WOR-3 bacterium TaxID=2052148 RepID=A0A7V0T7I8_UNCW3|nr:DUF721 domain-containing protein [candidate division WOR-3 bacterium]
MAKRGRFRRLDRTIPGVLSRLGLDRDLEEQRLLDAWPGLVDKRIAGHTRAVALERGVLVVAVDSPTWMTQLRFVKSDILRAIAPRFRSGVVRDIRFVHGRGA